MANDEKYSIRAWLVSVNLLLLSGLVSAEALREPVATLIVNGKTIGRHYKERLQ
jgi:hypothetical protein